MRSTPKHHPDTTGFSDTLVFSPEMRVLLRSFAQVKLVEPSSAADKSSPDKANCDHINTGQNGSEFSGPSQASSEHSDTSEDSATSPDGTTTDSGCSPQTIVPAAVRWQTVIAKAAATAPTDDDELDREAFIALIAH